MLPGLTRRKLQQLLLCGVSHQHREYFVTRLINNLNSNEHMSLTFVAVPVSLHIKMVMNMIMVMQQISGREVDVQR